MKKAQEIDVKGTSVRIVKFGVEDYVCITDIAKSKSDDAQQTISNCMRNRMTIEYLGLWEKLYNPDFKPFEFEGFREDVCSISWTRPTVCQRVICWKSRTRQHDGPGRRHPQATHGRRAARNPAPAAGSRL